MKKILILFFITLLFSENSYAMSLKDVASGTTIEELIQVNEEDYFQSYEIQKEDQVYQRIIGKSFPSNGAVNLSSLRYLKVLHYNYDGKIVVGELIVNEQIAKEVLQIFQTLFEAKVEIFSMRLIDDFWDETNDPTNADHNSLKANNTSAFNYRNIENGSTISNHSLGLAIDINPLENPYVNGSVIEPPTKEEFIKEELRNQSNNSHVIKKNDLIYQTFHQFGFDWGGDWHSLKDYQHFEKTEAKVSKEIETNHKNNLNQIFLILFLLSIIFIKIVFQQKRKFVSRHLL